MEIWEQIGYCDCGRTWNAHGEAHCAVCHRHFTSDSGFDTHRKDGVCRDPKTLRRGRSGKLVFASTGRKSGQAWKLASESPHPFASKPSGKESQALSPSKRRKSPSRSSKSVVRRAS